MTTRFTADGVIHAVFALLIIAAALWWLPVCPGTHNCRFMVNSAALIAALSVLAGIGIMLSPKAALGLSAAALFNGMAVGLTALWLPGPCPSPMMHCHTTTGPVLAVLAALYVVFSLIDFLRIARRAP